MPRCYTCQEEIIFDKSIISKTGKQIPLWLDKKNAHGHDQDGNPIRQPLPVTAAAGAQQQTKQQYSKQELGRTYTPTDIPKTSQGGPYLDLKRTRVMLEDLTREVRELKEILNSRTILDTNRYEGKNDQIYNVIAPLLNTQGVVAAELLRDKQQNLDTTVINHAKKADEYLESKNNTTKFVDESKEKTLDERIPDSHDELLDVIDEQNNEMMKGVIDDE